MPGEGLFRRKKWGEGGGGRELCVHGGRANTGQRRPAWVKALVGGSTFSMRVMRNSRRGFVQNTRLTELTIRARIEDKSGLRQRRGVVRVPSDAFEALPPKPARARSRQATELFGRANFFDHFRYRAATLSAGRGLRLDNRVAALDFDRLGFRIPGRGFVLALRRAQPVVRDRDS